MSNIQRGLNDFMKAAENMICSMHSAISNNEETIIDLRRSVLELRKRVRSLENQIVECNACMETGFILGDNGEEIQCECQVSDLRVDCECNL